MENAEKQNHTWKANYYFRTRTLATRKLKEYETMGIKPNYTDRKVKKYTLRDYIEFLGQKKATEKWDKRYYPPKKMRQKVLPPKTAKTLEKYLFFTKSKKWGLCRSTQNRSDSDIATLFELLIALSKAFLGSPSSQRYPSKNKISLFFTAFVSISFSLIFPAVPRKVTIVLSESGVINIKHVPVGIISFFFV